MEEHLYLLIFVLLAGGYLAWSIGASDVANAVGTSVGSGAMTLRQAVVMAAILEFSGAFFFGSHVSETMQSGIVNTTLFENNYLILVYGMLAALISAGLWLQLASYYGWPVSTTHTIVGAMIGFGLVAGGWEGVYWHNLGFIITSWVISPLFGGVLSFLFFNFLRKRIFFSPDPLRAAIAMMPWLAGLMLGILSAITLFKWLESFLPMVTIFALIAAIALFTVAVTRLWISKKFPSSTPALSESSSYAPEIAIELEKAKRHLERIGQTQAAGEEVRYRLQLVLEEIQLMTLSMQMKSSQKSPYSSVEVIFGYLQVMSACLMAFAHGANDVSNAIGPMVAALSALKLKEVVAFAPIPPWTLALGGCGIVIGLATWGWRVIETIGRKITELTPSRGFAAELASAATILVASRLGLPISTTHTLVGAVLGIALARGLEALDMNTTRDIVISWIVTVPAGAIASILLFSLFQSF